MNTFIAIEPDRCIGCGTCLAACSYGHRMAALWMPFAKLTIPLSSMSRRVSAARCARLPVLLELYILAARLLRALLESPIRPQLIQRAHLLLLHGASVNIHVL